MTNCVTIRPPPTARKAQRSARQLSPHPSIFKSLSLISMPRSIALPILVCISCLVCTGGAFSLPPQHGRRPVRAGSSSSSSSQRSFHYIHRPTLLQSTSILDDGIDSVEDIQRRSFLAQVAFVVLQPSLSQAAEFTSTETPFHSAAYGQEEYTNSIVASRDTNISPKEVYDTIASDYLREAYDAAVKERGNVGLRALDVGAGAGVSTEVLYTMGYHNIDAIDWSRSAWQNYVVDDPNGYCPSGVSFYELDDERYIDEWRAKFASNQQSGRDDGLFDVIVFNFAVNDSKAALFATQLLNKKHGRLLAPINTMNDYWLKQTYKVMDSGGNVLWSAGDVGAWSVQFQPDVTQDTCSGVWCAPFNGFQKKK